jgi:hypothetical protein
MKTLEELLAEWEEGTLTAEGAAELKALLARPEARAGLVGDWLFYEAVYGALRAQEADAAPATAPMEAAPGWLKRLMLRLAWHELGSPLRWAAGAAVALVLLVLGSLFYWRNTPAARVADLRGEVTVERGGTRRPVRAGQNLYRRDLLHVPAGGLAMLALRNEATQLELGPATDFQVLGQALEKRFALDGGRAQAVVATRSRWRPLIVSTPQAQVTVVGTRFALEATPKATRLEVLEGQVALLKNHPVSPAAQGPLTVRAGQFAVAAPAEEMRTQSITACATREVLAFPAGTALFEAPGGQVVRSDLVSNLAVFVSSAPVARTPTHRYEQRIRCYLEAPATGDYTFWIQSSRPSELWLGADEQPASGKKIASVPLLAQGGGAPVRPDSVTSRLAPATYMQHPSQKSALQRLTEGTRYYLEIRHEHEPNDFVMVRWSKPGEPTKAPSGILGGSVLVPCFETSNRTALVKNR